MHPVLRSLPDYVGVGTHGQMTYCHVKGTMNIKLKDIYHYQSFHDLFGTTESQSIVVFAINDNISYLTLDGLFKALVGHSIMSYPDSLVKPYVQLDKRKTIPLTKDVFLENGGIR